MCIVNVDDTSEIGNLVEEFSFCVYEREVDEISEDESIKLKYSDVLLKDVEDAVRDVTMFEEVLF